MFGTKRTGPWDVIVGCSKLLEPAPYFDSTNNQFHITYLAISKEVLIKSHLYGLCKVSSFLGWVVAYKNCVKKHAIENNELVIWAELAPLNALRRRRRQLRYASNRHVIDDPEERDQWPWQKDNYFWGVALIFHYLQGGLGSVQN